MSKISDIFPIDQQDEREDETEQDEALGSHDASRRKTARPIASLMSTRGLHNPRVLKSAAPKLDLQQDLKPSSLVEKEESSTAVEHVL
ncbi:hypothetical protein E5D57_000307 [Metarhizium anisopliae]|nr:hypothetical protein E5D57_000307 [Metarhizium anisopliae]